MIGASWGGYMAWQIAQAGRRSIFPPRCLVVLDPLPPVVGAPLSVQRVPMRETIKVLLLNMIGAAHSERQISMPVQQSLEDDMRHWKEADLFAHATQLLVEEGIVSDSVQSVVTFSRQASVQNQGAHMLRQHLAQRIAPPQPSWQTMLVLASEREVFFASSRSIGITADTAGAEAARLYANVACELELEGAHLAVVQRCSTGEDVAFMKGLRGCLAGPSDLEEFVLHSITSGSATRPTNIALNGPPKVGRLSSAIMFVLCVRGCSLTMLPADAC